MRQRHPTIFIVTKNTVEIERRMRCLAFKVYPRWVGGKGLSLLGYDGGLATVLRWSCVPGLAAFLGVASAEGKYVEFTTGRYGRLRICRCSVFEPN
jgi:hypothetical protein